MPRIKLQTKINAPVHVCFDLARSIDLHLISVKNSKEEAIAGKTTGLIGLNEEVTWRATHFGIRQELSSKITRYDYPHFFRDEMVKGIFARLKHDHMFEEQNGYTVMTDIFVFESPFGIAGKVFNWLVLTRYMKRLLTVRNEIIKNTAEAYYSQVSLTGLTSSSTSFNIDKL